MRPNIELLDLPDNKKIVLYKARIKQLKEEIDGCKHITDNAKCTVCMDVNHILQKALEGK